MGKELGHVIDHREYSGYIDCRRGWVLYCCQVFCGDVLVLGEGCGGDRKESCGQWSQGQEHYEETKFLPS